MWDSDLPDRIAFAFGVLPDLNLTSEPTDISRVCLVSSCLTNCPSLGARSPSSATGPRYESDLFLFHSFTSLCVRNSYMVLIEMCFVEVYVGICCALGKNEDLLHPSSSTPKAELACSFFSYSIFCLNFFY